MVMKRNMMGKNLRQTIRKSLGRYIAIVAIIALGCSIFVGLRITKTDMVATGQKYTDTQNMFDLRLLSTYGWTQEDLDAIIAGLQDGTIDCIATDHAPHHIDEKRVEFAQAANGLVGFETAFGLSYKYLVETGKLTLAQLVEKMSLNPGLILGIGNRLAEGECADITVVDLNKEYTVEVAKFLSKSKNSPYDGWKLKGSVVHTIVDGRI